MGNKKEGLGNPGLPELPFSLTVPQEYIDANGHMNNASYLTAYQDARSAYFLKASGMTMREAGIEWGIMSVVVDFEGKFISQLFEGNQITIFTSARPTSPFLKFYQRITKDDKNVNLFDCRIALIDTTEGKLIRRIPDHVKDVFEKLNSTLI